jgi:pimeloyl-ACP methyl ester carboxylesterase
MSGWQSREIAIDDAKVVLLEAGEGRPLLILHDELGPAEWQNWHGDLARHRRLIMPIAPGFRAERFKWMRNVTDLSRLYGRLFRQLALGPLDVVGFSFGGWVAAEMAVNDPTQFRRAAFIAPFGIKPSEGYITDMYILTTAEYLKMSVADVDATPEFGSLYTSAAPAVIESWEDGRIETAQLGWEPYMHNPALPWHLRGAAPLEALIVWGDKDAILPRSAVDAYTQALPGARLEVLKGCGHRPEIERREDFVRLITRFMD